MAWGSNLPNLGVGLGYRRPWRAELMLDPAGVDFLELTIEHFLEGTAEHRDEISILAERFPLVLHGLDLSVGSAEGLDDEHLRLTADLVRRVSPPWWSEHLCFTRAGDVQIGHLCPLPFSREAVEMVCCNLRRVQEAIETPVLLENISYDFETPGGEMDEAAFVRAVVEEADCGLLLDVTNVYTNALNHGFDAQAFLARLPLARVVELHVAGGHWQAGRLIDSHGHTVPEEVWELVDWVRTRADVKAILIERDEHLGRLAGMRPDLERARTPVRT